MGVSLYDTPMTVSANQPPNDHVRQQQSFGSCAKEAPAQVERRRQPQVDHQQQIEQRRDQIRRREQSAWRWPDEGLGVRMDRLATGGR